MKAIATILVGLSLMFVVKDVSAKCYSGQEWKKGGSKFYVCLHGGETWANRHKAERVCGKIRGTKCDAVNTYSSSCNGHCYDANGNRHHNMTGYCTPPRSSARRAALRWLSQRLF